MGLSGYFAPFVDQFGLHLPTYTQILTDNIQIYRNIYGQSVYLGTDASDYQDISARSLKQSDTCQAIQLAYNARSVLTAVGTDLDSIVKPTARKLASFSTAPVSLSGVAGTVITNGQVQDTNGNQWTLPSPVTIGGGGTLATTVTAANSGPISAANGVISIISQGGTAGWTGVTNTAPASLGTNVEADSSLRARYVASLALPSSTRLAGTIAAIEALPGVTRNNCVENPTGATDSLGNPAHSITCVIEGGVQLAIAQAIYTNKGPGCFTNGTTTQNVTDPVTGVIASISFDRPTYVPIYVTIVTNHLTGFVSSMLLQIQTAITNYLNSLQIGENVTYSAMWAVASSVMPNLAQPNFSLASVHIGITATPTGTTDIALTFNEVAQGVLANVVVS
jgi:uncharacterized phage protein gp47/JayE